MITISKIEDILSKKIRILILILYFSLVSLTVAFFLPVSSWGFYYSQVVSNIYAEDFNFNTDVGLQGKGLFFYLLLMRSLSLLCNSEPMALAHIAGTASIFMVISIYVYVLLKFPGNRWLKLIVAILYPFIVITQSMSYWFGYVLPYSIILMLLILSIVFYKDRDKTRIQNTILLIMLWVALGIYWHSFQVLTFGIILTFFVTGLAQSEGRKEIWHRLIPILLISSLFVMTWIYLREQTLYNLLSISDIKFDLYAIFNKGSFTGIYSYQSTFNPVWKLDYLRYIGYLLSFGVLSAITTKYAFNILKREAVPKYLQIIASLLISEIIFMALYFFATGETAPRILSVISLPLLLIILNSDIKLGLNFLDNATCRKVITIILVCSTCSVTPYAIYAYFEETAEKNIAMENFESSLDWILDYVPRNTITSNSHTCGNYMLLYGHSTHWIDTQRISFKDMTHRVYENIVAMEYNNPEDEVLVINNVMYAKHLKQESIQYWNVYNPIPPACTDLNPNLTKLYADGTMNIYI